MPIKSVIDMVKAAKGEITTMPLDQAIAQHGDEDLLFVDIRDPRELARFLIAR